MTRRGESQEDKDEKIIKKKMLPIKCNYEACKEKHKEDNVYDKKNFLTNELVIYFSGKDDNGKTNIKGSER